MKKGCNAALTQFRNYTVTIKNALSRSPFLMVTPTGLEPVFSP